MVAQSGRAALATYVAVYELTPTLSVAIKLENGQLMEQASNERKFSIFPESQTKFFLKVVDGQLEFLHGAEWPSLSPGLAPAWPRHALGAKTISVRHTGRCRLRGMWAVPAIQAERRLSVG